MARSSRSAAWCCNSSTLQPDLRTRKYSSMRQRRAYHDARGVGSAGHTSVVSRNHSSGSAVGGGCCSRTWTTHSSTAAPGGAGASCGPWRRVETDGQRRWNTRWRTSTRAAPGHLWARNCIWWARAWLAGRRRVRGLCAAPAGSRRHRLGRWAPAHSPAPPGARIVLGRCPAIAAPRLAPWRRRGPGVAHGSVRETDPFRPWLLETRRDRTRRDERARAADWVRVGETCGRGRQDRTRHARRRKRGPRVSGPPAPARARLAVPRLAGIAAVWRRAMGLDADRPGRTGRVRRGAAGRQRHPQVAPSRARNMLGPRATAPPRPMRPPMARSARWSAWTLPAESTSAVPQRSDGRPHPRAASERTLRRMRAHEDGGCAPGRHPRSPGAARLRVEPDRAVRLVARGLHLHTRGHCAGGLGVAAGRRRRARQAASTSFRRQRSSRLGAPERHEDREARLPRPASSPLAPAPRRPCQAVRAKVARVVGTDRRAPDGQR